MTKPIRHVVTGRDANGKSVVIMGSDATDIVASQAAAKFI